MVSLHFILTGLSIVNIISAKQLEIDHNYCLRGEEVCGTIFFRLVEYIGMESKECYNSDLRQTGMRILQRKCN